MKNIFIRIQNKKRRILAKRFCTRPFELNLNRPIISFTFDDFPRTALINGGKILNENNIKGSFYISMKLLNSGSPSGKIVNIDDLKLLYNDGHELGCHTYNHYDAWHTSTNDFLQSIKLNVKELKTKFPDKMFHTFAYPKNGPTLSIKKNVGKHFLCCRGGGNNVNEDTIDLNLLNSYFLDYRIKDDVYKVKKIIDYNTLKNGWLVFSTHDISNTPSKYGCNTKLFREIVEYAIQSNSLILPLYEACKELGISRSEIDQQGT